MKCYQMQGTGHMRYEGNVPFAKSYWLEEWTALLLMIRGDEMEVSNKDNNMKIANGKRAQRTTSMIVMKEKDDDCD